MNKNSGKWEFPNTGEDSRSCFGHSNYICEMMKEGQIRPIIPIDPPKQDPCEEWYIFLLDFFGYYSECFFEILRFFLICMKFYNILNHK